MATASAQARIIAPVSRALGRAGTLAVLSGALWPVQAMAVAWAISGWADGTATLAATLAAALIFAVTGGLRAALDARAGAMVQRAADDVIARERAALTRLALHAPSPAGSAATAALIVQKLPLLAPWITRYRVAAIRVAVLPALIAALALPVSWIVTLALLLTGPLIPLFMALIGMAAQSASRRQLAEIASLNGMAMERLTAMLDIRALGAVDRAAAAFTDRADTLRQRSMAVLRIAFLSSAVLELFASLGVAMVAVFVGFTLLGALGFGTWGQPLSLQSGLFLLLIAPEFFQPLRELAAAWHDRAAGLAVADEIEALHAEPAPAVLGAGAAAAPLPGPLTLTICGAAVALTTDRALPLPDLHLTAGEAVALTGRSGAGKTMTLAALAGLVPLAEGTITVCGQPLDAATADHWRARLALIPQRPHFGDARLADWLDPRASRADPWPALRLAEADGIVHRLPDGLGTRLGEAGGGVSGGEARRLMLARALLSGGELILADEPTADLDAETAARVIAALLRMRAEGRTILAATHDPALIAALDRAVAVPG